MTETTMHPHDIMVPKLRVVQDPEAQAVTKELMWLCDRIIEDPQAYVATKGKNAVECRVRHRENPGLMLQAIRATSSSAASLALGPPQPGPNQAGVRYSQLGVLEQNGDGMSLSIEHRALPFIDFRNDPFVGMIMDHFRSHLQS